MGAYGTAGCGGGDAVEFCRLARGLSKAETCRAFLALAGGRAVEFRPPTPIRPKFRADEESEKERQRENWPIFESPLAHPDDTPARAVGTLAKLRSVSLAGVELTARRRLLYFAAWKGLPAWIVTDGARLNAQARRMDGKRWPEKKIKDQTLPGIKAQTLPGSRAAWPVGIREAAPFPVLLLCEGGPDLLAAHHFIMAHKREADTAAVAMLGAGLAIHPDALPLFAGKVVRVFAHADDAGREAAVKWATQLDGIASRLDALSFEGFFLPNGAPVKDLNDAARLPQTPENEVEILIPDETEAFQPA